MARPSTPALLYGPAVVPVAVPGTACDLADDGPGHGGLVPPLNRSNATPDAEATRPTSA